jgi:hypothetical protein
MSSFCPKYSPGGNPPQQDQTLAPNRNGGHQIKRQKSVHNQQPKNSWPLSASGPTGEVRRGGIGVREVGNADFDGYDGQHTTASDRFAVKGVNGEPKALMSSQYICGTSRLDTSHIVHDVLIRDGSGEMQRMRALIDCGATSLFMAPRLRKRLGLADEPAYVTTLGLDGQIMAHASESRKTTFTVQYMEQLSPVQESEVLVMPMRAYDLIFGLPWFQSRNPDVDWQSS